MAVTECVTEITKNLKKVTENFGKLSEGQDSLNTNGMWGIKKKVFPKNANQLPVAKRDFNGKIITNPELLKEL